MNCVFILKMLVIKINSYYMNLEVRYLQLILNEIKVRFFM